MNVDDKIREQISAMLDGELAEQEQELLLKRLASDKSLQQTFERYQLIHDSMSNQLPSQFDAAFADRLQLSIKQEPEYTKPNESGQSRLFGKLVKPLAGIAVAAAMTVVTLVTLNTGVAPVTSGGDQLVAAENKKFSANPMRWDTPIPEVGNNLNSYLVNHNEYTSSINIQGMLQYVRIAGYDVEQK